MARKFTIVLLLLCSFHSAYSMGELSELFDLPVELTTYILQLVEKDQDVNHIIKNIAKLRTNREWKTVIDEPQLWQQIFRSFFHNIESIENLENQIEISSEIISKKIMTKKGDSFESEFLVVIKTELSDIVTKIKEDMALRQEILESIENLKYEQAKKLLNELKEREPLKLIFDSLLPEISAIISITSRRDFKQLANSCQQLEEIINKLINSRVLINAKDQWGKTALISFASFPNAENMPDSIIRSAGYKSRQEFLEINKRIINCFDNIIRTFIKNGADVNTQANTGVTALMGASRNGHTSIVKTLLDIGRADVNSKNSLNETALMMAAAFDHKEIVQMLIDKGADVNVKTDLNDTALTLAEKGAQNGIPNSVAIVEMLKMAGAD